MYKNVNSGPKSFFISKKKKIHYHKHIDNKNNIIGYVSLKKLLHQQSLLTSKNEDNSFSISNSFFEFEETLPLKQTFKIYGYLEMMKESSNESFYIALYGKRKLFFGIGLMSLLYFSPVFAATTIAASVISLSIVATVVIQQAYEFNDKPSKSNISESKTVDYDGSVIVNNTEQPSKDPGSYDLYLYSSFVLKKGEGLPLVNEKTNDVIFNYIITENNKTILNEEVYPGKAYPWIPTLSSGTHNLTMNINVWSLDKKVQWLGRTYDITITINNN